MIPRLDPARLDEIERTGGKELRRELVATFLQNINPRLSAISEAYASQDFITLARTAHSLKSAARWVGAIQLAEIARELEHRAEQKDFDLPELLATLSRELADTSTALAESEGR